MNIILIGYRGTGKSTVAKLLAQRLSRKLLSTDAEVVAQTHLSIPEIVKQSGWDHFRELEAAVCRGITNQDGLIVDTGGGVILKDENVEALKLNGVAFWLTAEIETITSRIGTDTQRPSLSGTKTFVQEIGEVLRDRQPKYQAAADHKIPTDHHSPEQIVDLIIARLPA